MEPANHEMTGSITSQEERRPLGVSDVRRCRLVVNAVRTGKSASRASKHAGRYACDVCETASPNLQPRKKTDIIAWCAARATTPLPPRRGDPRPTEVGGAQGAAALGRVGMGASQAPASNKPANS